MHTYHIKSGTIDVSIELEIIDETTGQPELGVLFNTAGIDLKYRRDGAAAVAITEVTLAALTTAHTDGGFLEIGNGVYRLDLPDAATAAGVGKVVIFGTVTGMVVIPCVIQLVAYDPFDTVRLGLTALPNAAAAAAGGLFTRGTGAGQINQAADGMIDVSVVRLANVAQSLTDLKDFADDGYDPSTNKVQGVVLTDTVTTYTGNTPQTGDVFPLASTEIADIKTKTDQLTFTVANQIDANVLRLNGVSQSLLDLKDFADDGYDPSTNKVQGVVLTDTVTTYTGNTPQTGDVFPLASTEIADIKAKTDLIPAAPASTTNITAGTITTVTNLTNAPTSGDLTATMKTSVRTEADAALVAVNLDHLLLSAVPTNFQGAVHDDSVIGHLAAVSDANAFNRTTDSLQGSRDGDYVLHTDYDAAKTAATQASVNNISTLFPLRINTAGQHIPFYMRDSTDPKLGKTGVPTITKSLDGTAAWSATTGTVTEIGNGAVDFSPSAADCNGTLCRYKAVLTGAVTQVVDAYTHV